jgi:hypothetical protein
MQEISSVSRFVVVLSVLNQFQGTAVAPADTGRARRYAAKITFQRDAGFRLYKIRFFRTGCPADRTHIILLAVNLYEQLRGAGRIDKWSGNHRVVAVVVPQDTYPRPPGVGGIFYMVQGAGNFAMSATGALAVVNLYPGHLLFSPIPV